MPSFLFQCDVIGGTQPAQTLAAAITEGGGKVMSLYTAPEVGQAVAIAVFDHESRAHDVVKALEPGGALTGRAIALVADDASLLDDNGVWKNG